MRKFLPLVLIAPAVTLIPLARTSRVPQRAAAALPQTAITFRAVFGARQQNPADYSGSVSSSTGKVLRVSPWRFFDQDKMEGERGWTLNIKRRVWKDLTDQRTPLETEDGQARIVPAGVVVTVDAPRSAVAHVETKQGNFDVRLDQLRYGAALSFLNGDAIVELTPTPERVSGETGEEHDYSSLVAARDGSLWMAWQAYKDGGDNVYARRSTASGWGAVETLTDKKGDVFGTAIGEDQQGRIHVVWSERFGDEWQLYSKTHADGQWGPREKLTSDSYPNVYHRMIRDRSGNLHLVWVGHIQSKSHVFWSKLKGDKWSEPVEVSGESAWAPEAAADSAGNLYVVWDSYRTGNYDVFLRRIAADGTLGEIEPVTNSPLFEAHPTVAVDGKDQVWVAWDESGANWGKDWTHEDPWRSTVLYDNRRTRVAVRTGGVWKQPVRDVMETETFRNARYVELPRIAADSNGRIWMAVEARTVALQSRTDVWAFGGQWEHFLTSYEGDRWTEPMPVPDTVVRPEGPFLVDPGANGVRMCWTTDNRPFVPRGFYARPQKQHDIYAAEFHLPDPPPPARLEEYRQSRMQSAPVHPNEREDLARIRGYRTSEEGTTYHIVRGDFHRHTEISTDGAGDGSLEDYFRYMIDAAGMDTGIVSDHNAGNNYEYSWWRTEKAIDLFHIPGGYTPLFGYERSVAYPNGHRNVVFAQRGVHTLPISREEERGKVNSGQVLYPYLRKNNGIAMSHSSATSQGTDWRDNDPALEPLVEIYQGYHASYEYEGAPRAESQTFRVQVHGRYRPAGFWWNALAKGFKLGVESSSDHISTHSSYTMIYTPGPSRKEIVESMRVRHAYGATDNIVVDYQAQDGNGQWRLMGEEIQTRTAPRLRVKVLGTAKIQWVEIIKDKQFVFKTEPGGTTADFTYVDNNPQKGTSYYYVRVQQEDRNLAWSSPIWVTYNP